MKIKPTLSEGIILALTISILSALFFMGMTSLFSGGFVLRILIPLISLFYIIYLFSRHSEKTGKMTTIALWFFISLLNQVLTDSTLLFITIHISMIWLLRSLYFYNSLWSSALDLALSLFALVAGIITWEHTGSLLLSLWSFFLIQALFVFIPKQFHKQMNNNNLLAVDNHNFDQASVQAQTALQKLRTQQSSHRR